jgi:hypothetical protein
MLLLYPLLCVSWDLPYVAFVHGHVTIVRLFEFGTVMYVILWLSSRLYGFTTSFLGSWIVCIMGTPDRNSGSPQFVYTLYFYFVGYGFVAHFIIIGSKLNPLQHRKRKSHIFSMDNLKSVKSWVTYLGWRKCLFYPVQLIIFFYTKRDKIFWSKHRCFI